MTSQYIMFQYTKDGKYGYSLTAISCFIINYIFIENTFIYIVSLLFCMAPFTSQNGGISER